MQQLTNDVEWYEERYPTRGAAMHRALTAILQDLNEAGVRIRRPVDITNIRLALGPAVQQELMDDGVERWREVWGGMVPENQQLDLGDESQGTEAEAGPSGTRRGDTDEEDMGDQGQLGPSGPSDFEQRQLDALNQMGRAMRRPPEFSVRPGGFGLNVLDERCIRVAEQRLKQVVFDGMSRQVANLLFRPLLKAMAFRLAHTGTSAYMESENYVVEIVIRDTSRAVDIGSWVQWMAQGGDNSRGPVSWLRRYARAVLAVYAFKRLRMDVNPTPFVAKYGISRAGRAIAFDFSDGVPDTMLSAVEHRCRPLMRRRAIAYAEKDMDIAPE